jgi:hypothetical protein
LLYQLSYAGMAVGLGVEPSEPFQALRISNPLHYHPAPRPILV